MAISLNSPSLAGVISDCDKDINNPDHGPFNLKQTDHYWRLNHPDLTNEAEIKLSDFAGNAGGCMPSFTGWSNIGDRRKAARARYEIPQGNVAEVSHTPSEGSKRMLKIGMQNYGSNGSPFSDCGVEIRIHARVNKGSPFNVSYDYRPTNINSNSFEGHMMVIAYPNGYLSGEADVLHNRVETSTSTYTHNKNYTAPNGGWITCIFRMIRKGNATQTADFSYGNLRHCTITRV